MVHQDVYIQTMDLKFVKEVCSKCNVRIVHGCPYHPQSQGQVENLNRRVKNCLRHFLLEHEEDDRAEVWPQLIGEVEYFVNHTWHHTIRNTPYFVFFGRIELHNVGNIAMQPEFMEEDFLYVDDEEDQLEFNPQSDKPESELNIPVPQHHVHIAIDETAATLGYRK